MQDFKLNFRFLTALNRKLKPQIKLFLQKKLSFLLFMPLCLFFSHCKTVINNSSSITLPSQKKLQEFNFMYLQAKAKVSYKDFEQSFKSSVDIRIKKDSAIWLSFRPAMSIEAMRVLITQDSIKILDRLKGEEYLYAIRQLSKEIKFDLRYEMLQSALTGNLISNSKPDSILQFTDFQLIKQKDRFIELKSYVNPLSSKIQKVEMTDLATGNIGQLYYSQFNETSQQVFAFFSKTLLHYYTKNNEKATAEVELTYSKVEISKKPLRFPW